MSARVVLAFPLVCLAACSSSSKDEPAKTGTSAAPGPPAAGAPKLRVTGLEPRRGVAEGGEVVTIEGQAFDQVPRAAKVYFGNKAGAVVRLSDTEMVVTAPAGTPGETVDVLVIFEPGGELTLKQAFTFAAADASAAPQRPAAVLDTPPTDTGLTQDEIERVVRSRRGLMVACYKRVQDRKRELAGKVTVHFEIAADGTVADTSIVEDKTTLHDADVTACLERQFARLRFPAKGGAEVNYPLVFGVPD